MFAERAERGGEGGGREQLLGLEREAVICVREEGEEWSLRERERKVKAEEEESESEACVRTEESESESERERKVKAGFHAIFLFF